MAEVTTQLSLFLANKPGTLAAVCDALSADGINIYAFTTSDTVDHTVIRMVVENPRQALLLLERRGLLVLETQVLMIEGDNRPGSLAAIARRFAEEGANIEYAYCATPSSSERGLLIVRPDHVTKALRALNRSSKAPAKATRNGSAAKRKPATKAKTTTKRKTATGTKTRKTGTIR